MARLIPRIIFTGLYALGALAYAGNSAIHQAFPSELSQAASSLESAEPVVLIEYSLRDCTLPLLQRKTNVYRIAPGKCHKIWSSHSFRIRSPAVCPDGTLAQLALYADEQCNIAHTWMNPDDNYRTHLQIHEEDIGDDTTCFDTGDVDPPRYRGKKDDYFDRYIGRHGIAFVCEGMNKLAAETESEANDFVTEDHSPSQHKGSSPQAWKPQEQEGDNTPHGGGSVLGLVLVLAIIGLIALLTLATALYRFAVVASWIMNLFRPREGAISLN